MYGTFERGKKNRENIRIYLYLHKEMQEDTRNLKWWFGYKEWQGSGWVEERCQEVSIIYVYIQFNFYKKSF